MKSEMIKILKISSSYLDKQKSVVPNVLNVPNVPNDAIPCAIFVT